MGRFENFTPPTLGSELSTAEITMVEELTALANSASGEFIRKSAGSLVNATLSETVALSGLSDVTISSPTVDQVLSYNGSAWINADPTGGGGSGTVTSVSVVTANGVSGSVATATTTPAITLTLGAITPSSVNISGLTASEIVITDGFKNLASAAVATYPSLTELTYVKGVTSAIQTQINTKQATLTNSAGLAAALSDETGTGLVVFNNSPTFVDDITIGGAGVATGQVKISGTTSGTAVITVPAIAGTPTYTLPAAVGGVGTFLKDAAGDGILSWAVPAGSGDVSKVGTPVNNQIGVWTGDGTIEGDTALTFDTTTDTLATTLITATTVTAALTGNVTGNVSGTAATVTGAAQAAITSLGTLTTLTVDDITINGNTISSAGASSLAITPTAGQAILLDATISIDAGVVTGATSITSTTFVGNLTGTASGNLTSGGALGTPASGVATNLTGLPLTTGVTGVLPVANGGTNASVAGITAFNNITGFTAVGATGTTSTNLVFSTSPTLVTPVLGAASATSLTLTTDLSVADGGTGKSSWTQWLIPYADTTTSFAQIAIGTSGQVLTSNGAGVAPTFQAAAGGGNTYFNNQHIDQSGGTSDTYGVLAGAINGSNALFTVSQAVYATGTLSVYLNGQLQTQGSGEDWVETIPASGTFTFAVPPPTGSLITVEYQKVTLSSDTVLVTGNIGVTIQGYDADLAAIAGLTATTNNFIVSVASAWASRTPAEVKTTLSLNLVENTALSTWAGSANVTTLGTLTTLTVDDITINGNTISSAGASTLAITPTAGQVITFDGTVTLDAGVIAGATSITSTTFVGALTGNASGSAATVTGAAQTAITSLGTLTALDVDNININLNTISASSGAINITPFAGSAILLDATISIDAGVVTGATSITSTTFVGALTGTASGNLVSGGALGTPSSGILTNCTGLPVAGGGTGATTFTDAGVLIGNSTGAIQVTTAGTAGQVLTSNGAGVDPTFQAATGGGGGITWTEVTGTSQSAAVNNGYITNNAGLVTVTLPDTAAVGSIVRVAGVGAGGWKLAQNASEIIHFGSLASTTGVGGYVASSNRYDAVEVVCVVVNTEWAVISSVGNITVV